MRHPRRASTDFVEQQEKGPTINGYSFYRVTNDRFRFFYNVVDADGEQVAVLKFGHYTDCDREETYVYFKILNRILYDGAKFRRLLELPPSLGMSFNNFTAIDLAYDSRKNLPSLIKKMLRDKEMTTIFNGRAVRDRKSLLHGVFLEYSTSLNRMMHPTLTFKQKKATSNKNEGITVQCYDKRAEIDNHSNKQYILDRYGNPRSLYRLEVRLPYRELKDYFASRGIAPTEDAVFDSALLADMFLYHLGAVIRFTQGRKRVDWGELLGFGAVGG